MRLEEFTNLVADVRTGRLAGTERDGRIDTTHNGEPITLVIDEAHGHSVIKGGATIPVDDGVWIDTAGNAGNGA